MLQSKPVFTSALRGLSHRRGHVLKGVSSPRLGPFVLPQPGITGRYLQQECGAAASVRAGIPHLFKWAAAAVQRLSHPLLSHAQTHPVGGRTCYTPPFYHPPSFITPPNTPCGCSDVLSHPLVHHTPLGPPASCNVSPGVHKISHPPQDTTPGDNILGFKNINTGVCYLVSVTVLDELTKT